MTVWGISDLHLSFARPDCRARFAARWRDHARKIEQQWRETVQPSDLVLLPGDLSMAENHRDVQPDLRWLDRLPGTKIISRGNHDRWWNDLESIRPLLRRSQLAVHGTAVMSQQVVVCGSIGAKTTRNDPTPDEQRTIERELGLLETALAEALTLRGTDKRPLYVLWHYPPFNAYGQPGPWVERFERARVTGCLYGHLHIEGQWMRSAQGRIGDVRYYCVAADAIGFRPLKIDHIERGA
jgi:predicted phosphohydrolase